MENVEEDQKMIPDTNKRILDMLNFLLVPNIKTPKILSYNFNSLCLFYYYFSNIQFINQLTFCFNYFHFTKNVFIKTHKFLFNEKSLKNAK